MWWPIKVEDDTGKILAVWLNSTLGLLLLLSVAEVTRGPWVKFKKENLWKMPVPDIKRLSNEAREALLELYDKKDR